MTRIRKALALSLCAAALAAIAAPAAQANPGFLTTPAYPAIVTGESQQPVAWDIASLPPSEITCASNLEATLVGPTNTVTFRPNYAQCSSDPGFTPVTVTLNGCDYTLGFGKPSTTGQPFNTGTLTARIDCPAGQQIEIHTYQNAAQHAANIATCTYDVPPQGPVPASIYHNKPMVAPPDVNATVAAKFTGVSTIGAGFAPCGGEPLTGQISITLTGNYTLRAFQDINGAEGGQLPLDVG